MDSLHEQLGIIDNLIADVIDSNINCLLLGR